MRSKSKKNWITMLALLCSAVGAMAGQDGSTPHQLTASEKADVVRAVAERLEKTYIFPDVSQTVRAELEKRMRRNAYASIENGGELAEVLTRELREMTSDEHVMVRYSPQPLPPMDEVAQTPTPDSREEARRRSALLNHGVLKVERLPGNIGYFDLDFFADPEFGGEAAAAAMTLLADTDALIIDLRHNGGGYSRMVAFLASYLFEGDPVHLNDILVPGENRVEQSWTLAHVPGKKFGARKPVYILTSAKTFSAAEELAYDLKVLGRALTIGEKTRGGAHPVGRYRVSEHFGVMVPNARALNPHTKSNWQGTGIVPDVDVAATTALKHAHIRLLDELIRDGSERLKQERLRIRESLAKELAPAASASQ